MNLPPDTLYLQELFDWALDPEKSGDAGFVTNATRDHERYWAHRHYYDGPGNATKTLSCVEVAKRRIANALFFRVEGYTDAVY